MMALVCFCMLMNVTMKNMKIQPLEGILMIMEGAQSMEYICDKIIPVIEFEILNIYFKTKVVVEIFVFTFFMMYDIGIHQLNLEQFRNLKFLDEIPFKICVFFHLFSNECIIISYF